jgi:hypothetical protein
MVFDGRYIFAPKTEDFLRCWVDPLGSEESSIIVFFAIKVLIFSIPLLGLA